MPNMTITTDAKTFGEDDEYERAMKDFFSRGPYLEPGAREDGRAWPTRDELYDRRILSRRPGYSRSVTASPGGTR